MERSTVRGRSTLLRRGTPRTLVVEGCANCYSTPYPWQLRRTDHPSGSTGRSVGGDTSQSHGRERESRRSRALVLRSPCKHDADHVHYQGTEATGMIRTQSSRAYRSRSSRPAEALSGRKIECNAG